MAARAFIGVRTSNFTVDQASHELRTTANVRAVIKEIMLVQVTATAQSLGFGRAAIVGVTPTTTVPVREDPGVAAPATLSALAWGTSPTVPAVFAKRWNSSATAGVGIVWSFPRGFTIPISASAVIWNISTAVATDLNIEFEEG